MRCQLVHSCTSKPQQIEILYTFIRNECRNIQNQVEHKCKEEALLTLNTELTKHYNAMQGLLYLCNRPIKLPCVIVQNWDH